MASNKNRQYVDIMATNSEVTGSCILVIVKLSHGKTIKFAVDCGLYQEREYDILNYSLPFNAETLDFMLITHNHVDHIGRLPYLVEKGFQGSIYTSNTTSKLLPLALADSCKVLRDVSKRNNCKPLYVEKSVDKTMTLVKGCEFGKTLQITENIKVTFFVNGHLVGATLILIQISEEGTDDINILFTGDYNDYNMFFDVPSLPKWVLDLPLTVIQESTYGDMDSTEIHKSFEEKLLNTIHNGGTAVIPVFSLGRSQEIAYVIKCMQKSGKLSNDIPIYFDGKLAIKYTELYIKDGLDIKDDMRDFIPNNMEYVTKESRIDILESTECKIILTTSGMGSYGPAQTYIPEYLTRRNSLILFTGYTAEGTLGNRLETAKKGDNVSIGGLVVKKNSLVEYTTEFSAHAKADVMISFLKKFKNLKLVLVNHGETSVKEKFANRILDEVKTKKVGILGRDYFYRINPYGLVKTMGTKFY